MPTLTVRLSSFSQVKTLVTRLLPGIALVLLIATQQTAAQTLKADYQFQNTRSSSVGSSTLTDTGSNTFQNDIVDGQRVLKCPF